jgi:hypothetical protein
MADEIERLQHEEKMSSLEKKQRAAALMAEVAAANAQQIARKKQLAEQEQEEEARIAEYIRQKDAREQVRMTVTGAWPKPGTAGAQSCTGLQQRWQRGVLSSPCQF